LNSPTDKAKITPIGCYYLTQNRVIKTPRCFYLLVANNVKNDTTNFKSMKTIILASTILITIISCTQKSNSGSQTSSKDFQKQINEQEEIRKQLWKDKDYESALDLMLKFLEKFDDKNKTKYNGEYNSVAYNISCAYSLLNQPENAIKYLNIAIDNGYNNYDWMQKDTDFKNIRNTSEFKEALLTLREKWDYEYILRQYPNYSDTKTYIPKTTFQDANELTEFRLKYKLDSIAGTRDEFSKMVNLMKWVHRLVRHDGNSDNPANKSADQLIMICQRGIRGVNCRMMAMILNDAYLSMGFKSRYITCLPKNEMDHDCHVINMVYSNEYKKWLWMDPSFEVYVMDENNTPLGISEVREKLINNQFVKLSKGLNWNGKPYSGGEETYLHQYMAKNLFRFSIPIKSVSGYESAGNTALFINLIPTEYNPENVEFGKNINNQYYTSNAEDFWKNEL
jgi:hypothetical protein